MTSDLCACSFSLQGIFSEINLEGDAESELQQTEWLHNKQTGSSLPLFSILVIDMLKKKAESF